MAISNEQNSDDKPISSIPSSLPPPGLSINQLAALHSRERLLVHPLRWSDRQVALLDCRIHFFEDAGSAASHGNADTNTDPLAPKSRLELFLADNLRLRFTWDEFIDITRRLLRPPGGHLSVENQQITSLYFNKRPCANIMYCRISLPPKSPTRRPITFACFNHDETGLVRRMFFSPVKNPIYGMNGPGIYRQTTLLRLHRPADPLKDPFLVAVLISLAQQKRRRAPKPESRSPSFKVRLLFPTGKDSKSFNIFMANVQASFLDKLDFPHKEPAVNSGLDIYHRQIPTLPFQTFPRRLRRALTLDFCGETKGAVGTGGLRRRIGKKRVRADI
ncbi:uncharacterized protein B0H64DRAFT_427898 [Chaetomium fimeti]|uniref:Uncharacterized protein n=1 Tax=Chaetomium fimeti TaxID=1854472 RepID=A0AAE0H580_9PEZI|nr:hypothetical protein B0H64DRAFT_427898 [Chaetomium fimeti]